MESIYLLGKVGPSWFRMKSLTSMRTRYARQTKLALKFREGMSTFARQIFAELTRAVTVIAVRRTNR